MSLGVLVALAGVLVAVTPARQPEMHATPRETFERGRTAFGRAEYKRAIDVLHPLLYPEVILDSEGEVVQAHRMLGVAYIFVNRQEDAKREFHKLLELRPDYRFDPLLDPQQVVDAFNAVLKAEETEIAALEKQRKAHDEEIEAKLRRAHPPVTTTVYYERHSYLLNFVPFGAGQFQNGQRRKGWTFLGIEVGLAALSLGALTTNFALYGAHPYRACNDPPVTGACPPGNIDHAQEDTSRALMRVQVVSGGLFFAAALWGVVDALRHFQQDVPLTGPPAPSTSTAVRVGLTPLGLSADIRF